MENQVYIPKFLNCSLLNFSSTEKLKNYALVTPVLVDEGNRNRSSRRVLQSPPPDSFCGQIGDYLRQKLKEDFTEAAADEGNIADSL